MFDRIRRDPKLRENTIVFVASDNGPEPGAGSADPLKGKKGFLHEGGIRSPLIVWAPTLLAKEKVGTTNSSAIFSAVDLNASIYQLTGTAPPAGVDLDGEPLAETLLGKSGKGRESPLFFRRPPDRPGKAGDPDLAVRHGRWKLVCNYDGSRSRLYDIESDSGESTDVFKENSVVATRLSSQVLAWHQAMPDDAGDRTTRPKAR